MKISGFTIVRNAVKFNYPVVAAIKSVLPICDEFVVNEGYSDDGTLDLIKSINDPKIKIIQSRWDFSEGTYVLARQTNIALAACTGDWGIYVQSDEMIHEADLDDLKKMMAQHLNDPDVDALRFKYLHFFGSYYRYRIDRGWYQKQDRIVRNNGQIESYGDAWAFKRKDDQPLKIKKTNKFLYHYGWVHAGEVVTKRRVNHESLGFGALKEEEKNKAYSFGDLNRFPPYFGSHPAVMKEYIENHAVSREDFKDIRRHYWWHPCRIFNIRYKTFNRVKEKL